MVGRSMKKRGRERGGVKVHENREGRGGEKGYCVREEEYGLRGKRGGDGIWRRKREKEERWKGKI